MNRSLRKLKEQIVKANLLVQEAAFIAEELNKKTEYKVTLQIPAANLNANRKVCACDWLAVELWFMVSSL